MSSFIAATIFLGFASWSSSATAGAWNRAPGSGYAKLGSATFLSSSGCDADGVCAPSDPFSLTAETVFLYSEVGIAERLTLTVLVPYVFATNQSKHGVNFHTAGVGDALFGAQLGIVQGGPLVVAARTEVKIPFYRGGPSEAGRQTALVDGYPRSTRFFPALGDGQLDITTFLSLGLSIPDFDAFFVLEPGFRYRSEGITDATVVQGTAGMWFLRRHILLMLNTQRVFSMRPRTGSDEVRGKAFWALGPAAMVPVVENLSIELGADVLILGENAAEGVQLLWGVSYVF